jgi:hypothetical protein
MERDNLTKLRIEVYSAILSLTKKIIFNDDVSFEDRMTIRGELQDKFLNYIFTFNSENDLIIRDLYHDSTKCRNN